MTKDMLPLAGRAATANPNQDLVALRRDHESLLIQASVVRRDLGENLRIARASLMAKEAELQAARERITSVDLEFESMLDRARAAEAEANLSDQRASTYEELLRQADLDHGHAVREAERQAALVAKGNERADSLSKQSVEARRRHGEERTRIIRQLHELEAELARTTSELEASVTGGASLEHALTVASAEAAVRRYQAAQLEHALIQVERERARLDDMVEEITRSRAWRIGRALTLHGRRGRGDS